MRSEREDQKKLWDCYAIFKDLLKKITYKPGWTLDCWVSSQYGEKSIDIGVKWETLDVITLDKKVFQNIQRLPLYHFYHLETDQLVMYFFHRIENMIRFVEDHEFKEWFQFNGTPFHDPHPELKHDKPSTSADSQLSGANQEVRG